MISKTSALNSTLEYIKFLKVLKCWGRAPNQREPFSRERGRGAAAGFSRPSGKMFGPINGHKIGHKKCLAPFFPINGHLEPSCKTSRPPHPLLAMGPVKVVEQKKLALDLKTIPNFCKTDFAPIPQIYCIKTACSIISRDINLLQITRLRRDRKFRPKNKPANLIWTVAKVRKHILVLRNFYFFKTFFF